MNMAAQTTVLRLSKSEPSWTAINQAVGHRYKSTDAIAKQWQGNQEIRMYKTVPQIMLSAPPFKYLEI